ncbi:MAG TPA: hypothetical protein VIV12_00835 [Streptosporangiaceae bacterium]
MATHLHWQRHVLLGGPATGHIVEFPLMRQNQVLIIGAGSIPGLKGQGGRLMRYRRIRQGGPALDWDGYSGDWVEVE